MEIWNLLPVQGSCIGMKESSLLQLQAKHFLCIKATTRSVLPLDNLNEIYDFVMAQCIQATMLRPPDESFTISACHLCFILFDAWLQVVMAIRPVLSLRFYG